MVRLETDRWAPKSGDVPKNISAVAEKNRDIYLKTENGNIWNYSVVAADSANDMNQVPMDSPLARRLERAPEIKIYMND